MQGVQVVGVGGDEEVGAGAGFDLEAENLGAGEVADDPNAWVSLFEIAGGFGEGLAEGGGGEDVEVLGGDGVAGGEEKECDECLEGQGCARKSFFQKTLRFSRGVVRRCLGCRRGRSGYSPRIASGAGSSREWRMGLRDAFEGRSVP